MKIGQQLICEGLKDYGLKEVAGSMSNPEILQMIQEQFDWATDDSKISWCGIWLGKIFERLSMKPPKDHVLARRWLKAGFSVPLNEIKQGDLCVFWRGSKNDWRGHVGIYAGQQTDKYLHILGGNQNNKVGINSYAKSRLLDIRRVD